MIRNEQYRDGVCFQAEIIDLETDMYMLEVNGNVVETRSLTVEERQQYGPPSLDVNGVQAALLAAFELVPLEDAANSVGLAPEALVYEVEAWQTMKDAGLL
jgi:hypothetical protein